MSWVRGDLIISRYNYLFYIGIAILGIFLLTPAAYGTQYTIKPGDNLWSIARQNHTTVAKIKELNKLSSDKLDVGKKLQVPDNISSQTAPAATAEINRGNRVYQTIPANLQMTQPEVTSSVTVSRGAVIRRNLLAKSFGYIGRPYHYGGMSPKGFDCSGFVGYIFKTCGISLPHNAARQFAKGTPVEKNALIAGDLVFFRTGGSKRINHVGIFIGNNRFIHSATGRGISINTLSEKYYYKCYAGAKRIVEV